MDPHVSDLLSPYFDGQVTPEERRAVEAHLGDCPVCRAELAEVRALASALRQLPQAPSPRSFALGPRSIRPPALSGTMGGFVRAMTTIAASLVFVAIGLSLLINGLPHSVPTTAAPSFATVPARQPLAAPARPRSVSAEAQAAPAGAADSSVARPRPSAAGSSAASAGLAPASAAAPAPQGPPPAEGIGGRTVGAAPARQAPPQPRPAAPHINTSLLAVQIALLLLSLGVIVFSLRWWRR